MPKTQVNQEDEFVTFRSCGNIRLNCKSNWKYILGGAISAGVLALGTLYSMQSTTSNALASTREELAGQKATIAAIDRRTEDMQRDIKQLLQQRR